MNIKQVKEGVYKYKLPEWEDTNLVVVEKINGELFVRFEAGRHPSRLQDIPANAIFEKKTKINPEQAARILMDKIKLIEDPLEWQDKMDKVHAPINMRGSARFWATIEAKLEKKVYRYSAPELEELVIDLGDKIGLHLSTSENNPWIDYQFVQLEDDIE